MDEHELGEALLRAGAAEDRDLPDARDLASAVLARDRRQLRALGGLILALWLAGAAGIGFVLYKLSIHVPEYLALAALGTFLLVLASRRATLRQVNASLALISDQLRQLSCDRAGVRHAASTATAEGRPSEP